MSEVINNVVLRRLSPRQLDVGGDTFSSTPRLCKTMYRLQRQTYDGDKCSYKWTLRFPQLRSLATKPKDVHPLERNPGYAHTIPIVDIARATSAAPMYFDNVIIQNRKYGDGVFGTNNPAQELMEEVIQMSNHDNGAIKVFVSVGTGLSEISRLSNTFKELRTWINAAKKLATDSEKTHLAMLSSTGMSKIPYFRFNVGMKHDHTIALDMNMLSPINLNAVLSDFACEESKDDDQISNSTDDHRSKKKPMKSRPKKKTSKTLGSMKLDEWKTQHSRPSGITRQPICKVKE
ncbi:FabD/lysophospholipase-like protein [Venturia nashicola]|nr:FabD/lysophospholipase-like protein [Venturia nashicola]